MGNQKNLLKQGGIQCSSSSMAPLSKLVPELSELIAEEHHWIASRTGIAACDVIVFAWDVWPPGCADQWLQKRVDCIVLSMLNDEHEQVWPVGRTPRYPSDWHQQNGPQRALIQGDSAHERFGRTPVRQKPEAGFGHSTPDSRMSVHSSTMASTGGIRGSSTS
jgi:hypothetical protein